MVNRGRLGPTDNEGGGTSNDELARRELEVLEAGGMCSLAELCADDFVLHHPGRNPLAGELLDGLAGDPGRPKALMHAAARRFDELSVGWE